MTETAADTLVIDRLGREGDGLAIAAGRTVAVPFALPGERVEGGTVIPSSAQRVAPPCRHFGTCGNCVVQHLATDATLAWKRDLVRGAFRHAGIEVEVGETVPVPLGSRRRVVFALTPDGPGYHRRNSHEAFAARECPILVPEIERHMAALGRLPRVLGHAATRQVVTACDNGLDVQIVATRAPTDDERKGLVRLRTDLAETVPLIRVSVNAEVIVAAERPVVRFGDAELDETGLGDAGVTPPPGAFLQATRPSEAAMAERVVAHMSGAKRVADLFAGCGTFALRLGARTGGRASSQVSAFEADAAALDALLAAANAAGRPVKGERRDLHERPLTTAECERFDAVVLDPPRAGARAQCEALAAAKVARIAYVSCNPDTLARDAALLTAGGHRLASVTPIDQFLFSAEVEAVALFERPRERKRRPLFG